MSQTALICLAGYVGIEGHQRGRGRDLINVEKDGRNVILPGG